MITPIEVVQRNLQVGFPVVSKVPTSRPDTFVRVDMSAPNRNNLLQYGTLMIIQVYSTDLGVAIDLFDQIIPQLEDMPVVDPLVSGWEENTGPHEFPDPDISQFRWQMTGQLYHTLT